MRDREESESGGIAIDFALHTSLVQSMNISW